MMTKGTLTLVSLALVGVFACGATQGARRRPHSGYVVRNLAGEAAPLVEVECNFELRSTMPRGDWDEIGSVAGRSEPGMGTGHSRDVNDFRRKIQADVCALGGEAVVYAVNGLGVIIQGVVMRRTLPEEQATTGVVSGGEAGSSDSPTPSAL